MKIKFKFLIVMVMVLAAFCVTSASSTITTFKTGPFTVSVDLGMSCDDINISKPVETESLGGTTYTSYLIRGCGVVLSIDRYEDLDFGKDRVMSDEGITKDLLSVGADKDSFSIYNRVINGMSGAVGSGILPDARTFYAARYYASLKSIGYIYVWDNETMMKSILKTIKVTETA